MYIIGYLADHTSVYESRSQRTDAAELRWKEESVHAKARYFLCLEKEQKAHLGLLSPFAPDCSSRSSQSSSFREPPAEKVPEYQIIWDELIALLGEDSSN